MEPTLIQHIELRPNRDGQMRAYLTGTRVRVQDLYVESEILGRTPDEIVSSLPHLTLAQVHAALSYYFDHREAILEEMRQDESFVAQLRAATGPGPLQRKLHSTDGTGDAISS